MLDLAPQFPRTARAVELIEIDNGGHHLQRLGVGPALGTLVEAAMRAAAGGLSGDDLEQIEQYLAGLSDDDLEILCMGEHSEIKALGAPELVEDFLQRAFDA